MTNLSILPSGHNICKLAQWDTGDSFAYRVHREHSAQVGRNSGCNTNGYQLVHNILNRCLVGILSLHLNVDVIVTFPRCADGETFAITERHLHLHSLIGNTQTACLVVINLDAGGREGLQHVTAY